MARKDFNIPLVRINSEIDQGNIKALNINGGYLIRRSSLVRLKSIINDGFIYEIKVDDLSFNITFLDYPLDDAINERIEGRREPSTTAIIRALVREGSNVLELGGCYGYFTAIMANCVGKSGRVVSIEGTPNNFNILSKNMKLNNFNNVELHQVFIREDENSGNVYFDSEDKNTYKIIEILSQGKEFKNIEDRVAVPCARLTLLLDAIDFKPDHIFMDIEGSELDVFQDFSGEYLRRNRPTIVFEIHEGFYSDGRDLNFIKGVLQANDYYYRRVQGNLVCLPH